jgi:hypothetical protein
MAAQWTVAAPQAVASFAALLTHQSGRSVGEIQVDAGRKLGPLLATVGIPLREPNQPLLTHGRQLVLGVASFSTHDLQLLDEIAQAWDQSSTAGARLAVFDLQQCRDQEDVARFLPGEFGPVWNTPVLGVWDDGALTQRIDGVAECRQMLQREGLL